MKEDDACVNIKNTIDHTFKKSKEPLTVDLLLMTENIDDSNIVISK